MHEIEIVPVPTTEFVDRGEARLDSSGPVTEWSRWSYIATSPTLRLRCDSSTRITTLFDASSAVQSWNDPLDALGWMTSFRTSDPCHGPGFKTGWLGWISYDLGRIFETIPTIARDDLHAPLFEFVYYEKILALDRERNEAFELSISLRNCFPRIKSTPDPIGVQAQEPFGSRLSSNFTQSEYERSVERALEYIRAGDIFQVNLSQRLTAPLRESPSRIYERLQKESGATYGAFLPFDDYALISNSPELFLRVTPDPRSRDSTELVEVKRRIITRPIKGTRPHAPGMDEELRHSIKDQAELNMIVDLERNDLGRICEIGSVRVSHARDIESHPTVFHGVATIEGTLRDDVTFVDLLRATFPGGSVTGAPKIRAMQIIEELEPTRRGPYCGAIGFISSDGHIEFNLAIRTMIATRGQIHIPVGGGIVADSDPAGEYEETLVKSKAMLQALGISPDDLFAGR